MKNVVTLEAAIIQVREVEDGAGVGYNSRWHAKGKRTLATVCLGYATAIRATAPNTDAIPGGLALVDGVPCPFAGTVSMDLIIVDATEAPPEAVTRGAKVTLIGDDLEIDAVGQAAKTIGYEILTSLGRRYRRNYI